MTIDSQMDSTQFFSTFLIIYWPLASSVLPSEILSLPALGQAMKDEVKPE